MPDAAVHLPTAQTRARVATPVPDAVDVAIIGAGLGGLYTAARLARAGRRVAVLDAHYVAGGCATMFARGTGADRYAFDIGLHYVGDCGPGGVIPRRLAEVGVDVDWRRMDPDGFDELVFPDLRFRVPASLDLYRDRLVAAFPKETRGIDRYVRLLREVRILARPDAPKGWRMALEAALRGRLAAANTNVTLGAFLDTCTQDPRLRGVLAGQNGGYGVPPGKVSLMLHAGYQNHYFGDGAFYPRGGGQVIADQLAAVIEAAGGTIHLRHPVTRIAVDGDHVTGIHWRGPHGEEGVLAAPLVVSNADLKRTLLELLPGDSVPAELRGRAEQWEMAAALFLTCVAVRADLGALGMGATNYWDCDGYDFDQMYAEVADTPKVFGAYITSATRKDPGTPGHAPPGVETVELMALAPGSPTAWGVDPKKAWGPTYRAGADYKALKAEVETNLVARLEKIFPGSTREILHLESATPVTHGRFTGASEGTGYGLAATPGQFLGNRPGPRGHLAGLYFAGASTRAGHGILGAIASGAQAARAIERAKA